MNSTVFAIAVTAVALLATLLLRPFLEPDTFLPFLAAVWLSSWHSGRTGGIIAIVVSAIALPYFFPAGELLVRMTVFLAMAGLIAWSTSGWRSSRRLLWATLGSLGDGVVATDRQGRITFLNSIAETLTGWPRLEAAGKPAAEVVRMISEQTRQPVDDPIMRAMTEKVMISVQDQTALVSRSGAEVPVEYTVAPVREESGGMRGGILVFRDISKRRQSEEQAIHSQKMEAVGRLAGGVAGDFNNVLTVITGYAELLRAEIPTSNAMRRFVEEIIYAGERAAALTRHLLAFSRGSSGQARVIDLNSVITGMKPMLHRLVGQNIELILLSSPSLGRVRADPSQIEQVVVNLASNARDAMPQGGKLVIETANVDVEEGASNRNLGVKPGTYVMLAMSDTGIGMDPETRSRLFEPFFTTKAPGKGSGLGLATVYGTIKQSDGQVTVYTQPNCGTIFEIYLPRVKEALTEPVRKSLAKGSETILLVDDEEGVRKLVYAVLNSNGYDVLEANNGKAALAVYEKNSHKIDMVLTDIVMPQMNGFELGKQLTETNPALRILYMSGYRDNTGGAAGETPRAFLHKPFTPDVLLNKVREVLDA